MQEALGAKNLYQGDVDGLDGPATRTAIRAYREKYGLKRGKDELRAVLEHLEFNRQIAAAANTTTGSTGELTDPRPSN